MRSVAKSAFVQVLWIAAGCTVSLTLSALAQDRAVVAVDDSPSAEQLLAQAEDQAANNPGESARLANRVLVEFGSKLVRVPGELDRFIEARTRTLAFLSAHPDVLSRYRATQAGEADRMEALGQDDLIIESRFLTPAGLRACLRQAQRCVDEVRFAAAERLVDSIATHPDVSTADPALVATLRALAAAGLGNRAEVDRVLASLRTSADPTLVALAPRLTDACAPRVTRGGTSADPLRPAALGELPPDIVRLWSEPLDNSLYSRLRASVDEGGMGAGGLEGGLLSGRLLVSLPTIAGSTVLVNEGYVLRAFDAYSHQPRWYQFMGAPNSPRADAQAGDLLAVTVHTGRVLALSGHALATERSGGGRVVCVDLESGVRLWEFGSERLREHSELSGVFFYGAPTVAADTVIVLGRKVTARTETVSSVFGLSLETGELRFVTPAGAAPGIRIGGARPFTTPVVSDGWAYVATGAGTTLCLDPANGRVRWLRRDPVPVRDTPQENLPWELGGVCMCSRGLVTLSPGGDAVQLLDAHTGSELDSMPTGSGTLWGKPRYFLPDRDGGRIFAVGDGLVAFDVNDLRTPLWRLALQSSVAPDENEAILAATGTAGIRGRVQSGWLASGRPALIVPFLRDAIVVNADDGTTAMRIACRGPSNVVASEGIVAAATSGAVEAFMDANRAQRILVEALRKSPNDPDAVVGLIEFALRSGDGDLLSRACADASGTLLAVSHDEDRRGRLADLLIEAARSTLLSRNTSDSLFEAIVTAGVSPEERAIALLAQGDWLAQSDRHHAAARAWQALLTEQPASLALVPMSTLDGTGLLLESGGHAATNRLIAMERAHPGSVIMPQREATGSSADPVVGAAMAAGTHDAARLWIGAAQAALSAGTLAEFAGRVDAAIASAIALGDAASVTTVLDATLPLLEAAELPWTRAQLLDRCILSGFDPSLRSLGSERLSAVLARTPSMALVQGTPRPRVGCASLGESAPSSARLLRGILAPVREVAGGPALGRHAYLIADRTLTRLDPPDLTPRWTVPLLGDVRFVAATPTATLVVEQADRETVDVAAIDADGQALWRLDDVAMAVTGRQPSYSRSECVLFPGATDLVGVRADGWTASFSLRDSERLWNRARVIEQVDCADASETIVLLGGVRASHDEQASWLVALDRRTGTVMAEVRVPNDEPLRWVRAVEPGAVAFGTTRGVGRWQLTGSSAGIQWFVMAPSTRSTVSADRLGQHLVVSDATGRTSVLNPLSGLPLPDAFVSTGQGRAPDPTRRWIRMGGTIVTWTNNGIDLFGLNGAESGSVALHGARRIEDVLPSACAIVAIEQGEGLEEAREFGLGRQAASALIHRFGWDEGGRIMGPPVQVDLHDGRLDRAQLVDGWVLLGGPQSTLAVPLP